MTTGIHLHIAAPVGRRDTAGAWPVHSGMVGATMGHARRTLGGKHPVAHRTSGYHAAMTPEQIEQFQQRLVEERDEVSQSLDASRASAKPNELDQARIGRLSRMDSLQSSAMAQEAVRRLEAEQHSIDAAMERLKKGEYGRCKTCRRDIDVVRLDIYPATEICMHCAKKGS